MHFSADFIKFLHVVLHKLSLFNSVYRNICVGIDQLKSNDRQKNTITGEIALGLLKYGIGFSFR